MKVCATCAVERAEPLPERCPICADERQYVPASGQVWLSLTEVSSAHAIRLQELEPNLVGPEITIYRIGGHFPGSAVALWRSGAEGHGVLLAGDTIAPNPDRRTIAFMWSYPNRIPLSGGVAERIADQLEPLEFDRVYGNFGNDIPSEAKQALRFSARRHADWANGRFDHRTKAGA